jgi:hypothetical protein
MARMAEKHEARREGLGEEEAQCGEAFTYPRSAVLPRPLGPLYYDSRNLRTDTSRGIRPPRQR